MISVEIRKDLSVRSYQEKIDVWIRSAGVRYFDELTNLGILMEEVGEVSRIMTRTYGEQSFKKGAAKGNLGDELADVIFVACCIANQTGIDLTKVLEENLKKKMERDKDRHRNNPKLTSS